MVRAVVILSLARRSQFMAMQVRCSKIWLGVALIGSLLGVAPSIAQEDEEQQKPKFDIKAHYTKYEFRVAMRDGVKLFTTVYVPKDAAPGKTYPFLIERTPYSVGPYGADNYPKQLGPAPGFAIDGFIFVYQDVRGRFMSEGTFVEMTPHKDVKKSQKRWTRARIPTTRLSGC
jgi:hypothetical protein